MTETASLLDNRPEFFEYASDDEDVGNHDGIFNISSCNPLDWKSVRLAEGVLCIEDVTSEDILRLQPVKEDCIDESSEVVLAELVNPTEHYVVPDVLALNALARSFLEHRYAAGADTFLRSMNAYTPRPSHSVDLHDMKDSRWLHVDAAI